MGIGASELDIPGKQLIDALGRVIDNADDEVAEVRFGVDAVDLGGFNDRVHDGGAVAAAVGASKHPVLAAKDCTAQDGIWRMWVMHRTELTLKS
jgi:hypothetical protein